MKFRKLPATNSVYETIEEIHWTVGKKGSGAKVTVPIGFVFDVSIPTLLTPFFSKDDKRFLKAAAIHDYMLEHGWNRIVAAEPFSAFLKAHGVSRRTRFLMVAAVIFYKFD